VKFKSNKKKNSHIAIDSTRCLFPGKQIRFLSNSVSGQIGDIRAIVFPGERKLFPAVIYAVVRATLLVV